VERHHSALIVASAVTVASFVGATAYTQAHLAQLDSLSAILETNAIPSVDYLSRAAVRLTHLNQLLDESRAGGVQEPVAARTARTEVDAVSADLDRYLMLPPLPGESPLWHDLRADVSRALPLLRSTLDGDSPAALSGPSDVPSAEAVHAAVNTAIDAVLAAVDFDVRQSQTMAREIRAVRADTLRAIVGLDAVATAIAAIGLFVAYRASSRHDELVREHSALLAGRVTELDRFAGRMAHDVLNPLGTVAAGLALLERTCDEHGKRYVARSNEAILRVRELVEGLLLFARSGARPDPSARCSLDAVFMRIVADRSDTAADAGIALTVAPAPLIEVPCEIGVLTSVLDNLVGNAIKYIGSSPVRRITVRALVRDTTVRIEVDDTGPGIAPGLQARIFEPFFRGPDYGAGGTGLGLATVKRLAESHDGRVGVESNGVTGSLFWVELPIRPVQDAVSGNRARP
jgi:signal transduction histidine kinase